MRITSIGRISVLLLSVVSPAALSQKLDVAPFALTDEVVRIRVSGLAARQSVEIRATTTDSLGKPWAASAVFNADSRGTIDLSRDAPSTGSYSAVAPMALISLMTPVDGAPRRYVPPVGDMTVHFALIDKGVAVDSATLRLTSAAKSVRSVSVRDNLVGTLFKPVVSAAAVAGVLVLGGSEGGDRAANVAAQLASHGYVALSLAYFGASGLKPELDEIPLEIFDSALVFLRKQPGVDSSAIAIVGTSKGAEAALLVAAHDPRVRAVVAYAPSSVVWSCICSTPAHSSWSRNGIGIPNIPPGRDPALVVTKGKPQRPAAHYSYRMKSFASAEAVIPVEQIRGRVMVIAGGADALWPSATMADQIRATLMRDTKRRGDVFLVYPKAGHLIGKSYMPVGTVLMAGGRIDTGGSVLDNAGAQADAWPRVLGFLGEALGKRPTPRAP